MVKLKYKDISWTKKEFNQLLKVGDVIYVKKISDKNYSLKQLPKVNGGNRCNGSLYRSEF